MVQQALKKNIKKSANELDIGDEVRILNNALTQIKKYGPMKQTSLRKQDFFRLHKKYLHSCWEEAVPWWHVEIQT